MSHLEPAPYSQSPGRSILLCIFLMVPTGLGCSENVAGSSGGDAVAPDAPHGQDALEDIPPPPPEVQVADIEAETVGSTEGCSGSYGAPTSVGNLPVGVLVEVSGIVASRRRADLLWAHDDSGADARLFALTTSAQPVHQLLLSGVTAVDWEDIAAAPCPQGGAPCLWVADIGDNLAQREEVQILVVEEPELPPGDDHGETTTGVQPVGSLGLLYPDGPKDMESLVVDTDGRTLWLFEKVDGPISRIYKGQVPMTLQGQIALEEVGSFPSPGEDVTYGRMITGADLHPSGARLLLRVYTGTWEYPLPSPGVLGDLGSITPELAAFGPILEELQGEAVAYDADGTGFWTISEDPGGVGGQPLHHYDCQAPQGGP